MEVPGRGDERMKSRTSDTDDRSEHMKPLVKEKVILSVQIREPCEVTELRWDGTSEIIQLETPERAIENP